MYEPFDPIIDQYALSLVSARIPYIWGGDDPIKGFDCSGFVIELLRAKGVLPANWNAGMAASKRRSEALFDYFEAMGRADVLTTPRQGALVFYGGSVTDIHHVAWALNSAYVAEYAGGGPKVLSADDAAMANAYGRVRPFDLRSDRVAILRPKYRGELTASN